jgi:hypothetical protein
MRFICPSFSCLSGFGVDLGIEEQIVQGLSAMAPPPARKVKFSLQTRNLLIRSEAALCRLADIAAPAGVSAASRLPADLAADRGGKHGDNAKMESDT